MQGLFIIILIGIIGYLMLHAGLTTWKERRNCWEKVPGKCIKSGGYTSQGVTHTYAEFEYYYAGKRYQQRALDRLSGREMKQFVSGMVYPVYVNPQNPAQFRCTQKVVSGNDLLMVLFGGFFLLIVIFGLLGKLMSLVL